TALERAGAEAAGAAEKSPETRAQTGGERQELRSATGSVQERRVDLRLHPRPDGRWSSAQVVDAGGRIYSGMLGVACGGVDDGGRSAADRGPCDRTSRGADPHQER